MIFLLVYWIIYIWGFRYHPELNILQLLGLDPTQQEANAWGTCLLLHIYLKIYTT